ncbi:MAG: hypothetical protein F6K21_06955 [Symploca sp. SIO2D2]|nr:hypothetical protein [Symploca sp. SIO2D2]
MIGQYYQYKVLFTGLIITLLWISNCNPTYAARFASNSYQVQELSTIRAAREPINLEDLSLEYWYHTPENLPTADQLLKLSIRLRDASRYLGSKWPVVLPIAASENREIQEANEEQPLLTITDIKESPGNWVTMSAGQTLKLVTQELQLLPTSGEEPLIDFLVRDELSGNYHPLIGIPLSRYCYELLKTIKL